MLRGLGYLQDPDEAIGNAALEDILGDAADASELETLDCTPAARALGVRDQQQANSCTGFAESYAIALALLRLGRGVLVPSALHLYLQALAKIGRLGIDEGTTLQSMMDGVQDGGWLPEAFCPYDAERCSGELYLDESARALNQLGVLSHRVLDSDPWPAVKRARAAGKPVVVGQQIDSAFMAWQGASAWQQDGVALGGHAMCLLDYPQGLPRYLGSYGIGWGDRGLITTTVDQLRKATSIWVLDFVPLG